MMTRRLLGLLTLILATVTTIGLTTADPAAAASRLWQHKCAVVGTDSLGNKGVHCVNLYVGTYEYATNEIVCQNSAGATVQCAAIRSQVGSCLSNDDGTDCEYNKPQDFCGVRWGYPACPAGRFVHSQETDFWAAYGDVRIWGLTVDTLIVLPGSGRTVGGVGTSLSTDIYHEEKTVPPIP